MASTEKALSEYAVSDIEGYEGMYAITKCGRVYSHSRVNLQGRLQKGRWMKLQKDKDGYLKVRLQKEGSSKYIGVHRLVAMAFLPNPNNLPQVNHKDEVKYNNIVTNLEWCDASYNKEYSLKRNVSLVSPSGFIFNVTNVNAFSEQHGLVPSCLNKVIRGERHSHKGWQLAN